MTTTKKTVLIGMLCIATYMINYYLREMLSVFTPTLISGGSFNEAHVALLSSTYMCFYAGGQLINGFIGDIVQPKRMVSIGLIIAGLSTVIFPHLNNKATQIIAFAALGFALSMMRGPLMKTISENTEPKRARLICVFFSFAGFTGPLVSGIFAILFDFKLAYAVAGSIAVIAGAAFFVFLYSLEKKRIIVYSKPETKKSISSIFSVFKIEKFLFYLVIACLVEVGSSSISFWIPTYLTQHLGFDASLSPFIFSIISICKAFMPFVTLFIFNATGEKDVAMMRIAYAISTTAFITLIFVKNPVFNVCILILALMSISCTSSLLWSIFIPGLGKTGKVSSVNGTLDCSGYLAAAIANLIFANVISGIGWNGVIGIWSSIGVAGITATLFVKKKTKTAEAECSD